MNELAPARLTAGHAAEGLWAAVAEAAPELAGEVAESHEALELEGRTGMVPWLLTQFALNVPSRLIIRDLKRVNEDQEEDGYDYLSRWPVLTSRYVDRLRRYYEPQWRPIEARVSSRIENVGVLAKNRRLLALLELAERLRSEMFEERNEKTAQLYLIPEYRAVLRQIAEEKGELGEGEESGESALAEVAKGLVDILKVAGSGLQTVDVTATEYDYDQEGERVPFTEID